MGKMNKWCFDGSDSVGTLGLWSDLRTNGLRKGFRSSFGFVDKAKPLCYVAGRIKALIVTNHGPPTVLITTLLTR